MKYPGDVGYPTIDQWQDFNTTLKGKLIAAQPPYSQCYLPNFNEGACNTIRAQASIGNGTFFQGDPVAVEWPWESGNKCPLITTGQGPAGGCLLGNYSNYVIRAETAEDVQSGVRFAKEYNLRFVIKNTGHDFLSG